MSQTQQGSTIRTTVEPFKCKRIRQTSPRDWKRRQRWTMSEGNGHHSFHPKRPSSRQQNSGTCQICMHVPTIKIRTKPNKTDGRRKRHCRLCWRSQCRCSRIRINQNSLAVSAVNTTSEAHDHTHRKFLPECSTRSLRTCENTIEQHPPRSH